MVAVAVTWTSLRRGACFRCSGALKRSSQDRPTGDCRSAVATSLANTMRPKESITDRG